MPELLFYHLERDPLETVLPPLLERCLSRDWRALVRVPSPERAQAIDGLLWTWRDESFLPHGIDGASGVEASRQPVLITRSTTNANAAQVLFSVDGAQIADAKAFTRTVYLFNGHDADAVSVARTVWRWAKEHELELTYWQQSAEGQWQKRG